MRSLARKKLFPWRRSFVRVLCSNTGSIEPKTFGDKVAFGSLIVGALGVGVAFYEYTENEKNRGEMTLLKQQLNNETKRRCALEAKKAHEKKRMTLEESFQNAVDEIVKPWKPPEEPGCDHVPRPVLETQLKDYVETCTHASVVLVGEKGCGKSWLTYCCFARREGVHYARIDKDVKMNQIKTNILEACGFDVDEHGDKHIEELMKQVHTRLKTQKVKNMPLLIVEIERGTDPDALEVVLRLMKTLNPYCRGLAVVSDTMAALQVKQDEARRKFMWVGDFFKKEAMAYMQNVAFMAKLGKVFGHSPSSDELEKHNEEVIAKLGTRPAFLRMYLTESMTLEEMHQDKVSAAEDEVLELVDDQKYLELLTKVLQQEPLGFGEAFKITRKGLRILSKQKVLLYNPVNREFSFRSQPMRTAAQQVVGTSRLPKQQ